MSAHYRDAVADLFTSKPYTWIDGEEIRLVGGRYAYRTRISNCRTQLGMVIDNRVRWHNEATKDYRVSEYRYCPASLLEMAG